MQKLLVCTGHFFPHTGGVERYTYELWRRVADFGWDVTVLTTRTSQTPLEERVANLNVLRLPAHSIIEDRLPIPYPSRAGMRVLRKAVSLRPEVIVTNTRFFPTTLIGALIAQKLAVPHLHIDHGSRHIEFGSLPLNLLSSALDHTLGKWVVTRATYCVGVSKAVAEFLQHLGRPDVGVLYNGIDASLYSDSRTPVRNEFASSPMSVLYVGRLIEDKGIRILMEAWPQISNSVEKKLVVAGGGALLPEVKAFAANRSDVKVFGEVSNNFVRELMEDADLFVHPSSYPEGLPTTVLEAGASGLAVVATPMGGTSEVITMSESGILIPPRDPQALASAVDRLIQDSGLRRKIGSNLRQIVQEKFDWDNLAREANRLLTDLSDRNPGPS